MKRTLLDKATTTEQQTASSLRLTKSKFIHRVKKTTHKTITPKDMHPPTQSQKTYRSNLQAMVRLMVEVQLQDEHIQLLTETLLWLVFDAIRKKLEHQHIKNKDITTNYNLIKINEALVIIKKFYIKIQKVKVKRN